MSTSSFNYEREFFSFAENVTLNHFHHNYDVVLFVNLDFNGHALWFFFSLSISRHLWAFPAIKVHDHTHFEPQSTSIWLHYYVFMLPHRHFKHV